MTLLETSYSSSGELGGCKRLGAPFFLSPQTAGQGSEFPKAWLGEQKQMLSKERNSSTSHMVTPSKPVQ